MVVFVYFGIKCRWKMFLVMVVLSVVYFLGYNVVFFIFLKVVVVFKLFEFVGGLMLVMMLYWMFYFFLENMLWCYCIVVVFVGLGCMVGIRFGMLVG